MKAFRESVASEAFRNQSHGHAGLNADGLHWSHNLDSNWEPGRFCRRMMYYIARVFDTFAFPIGDLINILRMLPRIWRSDLVISSVENVGIPLLLTRWMGLWSTPFIYTSIGLPERLEKMHPFFKNLLRDQLRQASLINGFGSEEADRLHAFVNTPSYRAPVRHWTYGISLPKQSSLGGSPWRWDSITIGADPNRDFKLMICAAQERPDLRFLMIASSAFSPLFQHAPSNVEVRFDQPFEKVKEALAVSRLVALPILPNSYSGAVTTAFLAMAMGRPVLLSHVGAIHDGYGFVNGENCFLTEPLSVDSLLDAMDEAMGDDMKLETVALRGKKLVQECFTSAHLEAKWLKAVHCWKATNLPLSV